MASEKLSEQKITRYSFLDGKTELSDEDVLKILDLPVEKRSKNPEIFTDKSYKELKNSPSELEKLASDLKTEPEYLKYHSTYIAKSKLLYQESPVLYNEIPCLIILNEINLPAYLLPFEYAQDKNGNSQAFADALKSNVFTDFKRVFNPRIKKLIEYGTGQSKDIFFLINNKKLNHNEIKKELIKFSNSRESENKAGTFLFFSEENYVCYTFESDKNGFISELPEYDLKQIRLAIPSKPLIPGQETEQKSESLASNLNISQKNTAVNELFPSLLLRGEINAFESKSWIKNRFERYFDAVNSLENLNSSIQSKSIKESNSIFVKNQKESRFYKDVQNLFVKNTNQSAKEKNMEQEQLNNLSENYDEYIHSKEFISKFGDWEKANRLENLKNSESLIKNDKIFSAGEDITKTVESLVENEDRKSIQSIEKELGKNIVGTYINKDTGLSVQVSNRNVTEISNHHYLQKEHIQAIQYIPEIIDRAIFIDNVENEDKKKHPNIQKYKYFATGLNINGNDFTCKTVVGVDKSGNCYYDQSLSTIEKGKLIDWIQQKNQPENLSPLITQRESGLSENESPFVYYDKRLINICQVPQMPYLEMKNGEWKPKEDAVQAVKNGMLSVEKNGQNYIMNDKTLQGGSKIMKNVEKVNASDVFVEFLKELGTYADEQKIVGYLYGRSVKEEAEGRATEKEVLQTDLLKLPEFTGDDEGHQKTIQEMNSKESSLLAKYDGKEITFDPDSFIEAAKAANMSYRQIERIIGEQLKVLKQNYSKNVEDERRDFQFCQLHPEMRKNPLPRVHGSDGELTTSDFNEGEFGAILPTFKVKNKDSGEEISYSNFHVKSKRPLSDKEEDRGKFIYTLTDGNRDVEINNENFSKLTSPETVRSFLESLDESMQKQLEAIKLMQEKIKEAQSHFNELYPELAGHPLPELGHDSNGQLYVGYSDHYATIIPEFKMKVGGEEKTFKNFYLKKIGSEDGKSVYIVTDGKQELRLPQDVMRRISDSDYVKSYYDSVDKDYALKQEQAAGIENEPSVDNDNYSQSYEPSQQDDLEELSRKEQMEWAESSMAQNELYGEAGSIDPQKEMDIYTGRTGEFVRKLNVFLHDNPAATPEEYKKFYDENYSLKPAVLTDSMEFTGGRFQKITTGNIGGGQIKWNSTLATSMKQLYTDLNMDGADYLASEFSPSSNSHDLKKASEAAKRFAENLDNRHLWQKEQKNLSEVNDAQTKYVKISDNTGKKIWDDLRAGLDMKVDVSEDGKARVKLFNFSDETKYPPNDPRTADKKKAAMNALIGKELPKMSSGIADGNVYLGEILEDYVIAGYDEMGEKPIKTEHGWEGRKVYDYETLVIKKTNEDGSIETRHLPVKALENALAIRAQMELETQKELAHPEAPLQEKDGGFGNTEDNVQALQEKYEDQLGIGQDELRLNTATNFIHNFKLRCRMEARNSKEFLDIARELYKGLNNSEKKKFVQMKDLYEEQHGEKYESFMLRELKEEIEPFTHTPSPFCPESVIKPLYGNEVKEKAGTPVNIGSKVCVGDEFRLKLSYKSAFGDDKSKKDSIVTTQTYRVASTNPVNNCVVLMSKDNKEAITVPIDRFLKKAEKAKEMQLKSKEKNASKEMKAKKTDFSMEL